jgi:hypothetical protein
MSQLPEATLSWNLPAMHAKHLSSLAWSPVTALAARNRPAAQAVQ